jgi:hypothetical protein
VTTGLPCRARRGVGRLVSLPAEPTEDDPTPGGPGIVVTDGRRSWQVDLLPGEGGARAIAHFPDWPPPRETDLWISRAETSAMSAVPVPGATWLGLAGGTPVATPGGEIPVDRITPGMDLLASDGATVAVLQVDTRQISGARFCALPEFAPVRIAAGAFGPGLPLRTLLVGPDQDIALDSAIVRALFPSAPVTFAARDAVDGRAITRPGRVPGLTAHVLHLARPVAVMAAGLALATATRADARPLRCLSRGEVAILRGPGETPARTRTLVRPAGRC